MFESGRNWELFGYDTSNAFRHWRAAWRELLWHEESPVRSRLDEPVRLRDGSSEVTYQGGRQAPDAAAACHAVLLPESLVLSRELTFPGAVADELAAVLALEVPVHSPFAPDDTAYGWRACPGEDGSLAVCLVIASRSAVMGYLGREHGIHDPQDSEVWAEVQGARITLAGFAEQRRESLYRRRLIRCALLVGATLLLLLALAASASIFKAMQLQKLQGLAATVQEQSADASARRTALVTSNELLGELQSVLAAHPSPHLELARLTALLDDGAFLERFEMTGNQINLTGQAQDAASVMKRLTDHPGYASVEAPRAITRVRGTDREQFQLKITLASGVGQ